MCLTTVKRVTKIKKPLRVYKVVVPSNLVDVNFETCVCGLQIHPHLNVDKKSFLLDTDGPMPQEYEAGFHFYTNKRTAIKDAEIFSGEVAVGIIPAGTTVTFGTGLGWRDHGMYIEKHACQQVVAKHVIYETHTLSGKEV